MKNSTTIQCPECGTNIDVNDILKHQIEESIRKEFQDKLNKQSKEFNAKTVEFEKEKEEFEAKKKRENDLFKERLEKETKEAARTIEEKLKKKLQEENEEQYKDLQKELQEKSDKLKDLNKKEAEIARLKREKDEIADEINAKAEQRISEMMAAEKLKIKKQVEDAEEMKIRELNKQLSDQKKLVEDLRKKQEQGSMQLQGEVQELAIEEWLQIKFPLDTIEEIKKGANGADCLQVINTRESLNCGSIYYESKRTKNFQPAWIEKFKNDILDKKANLGVLVTEVLPTGMARMGLYDGIWICTYDEFKGLSLVLRQSLIQINDAVASQENKGEKMEMLYDYLTSNEFKMQMEAIVEGFTTMERDLSKEKRAMKSIWKRREKQIEKVINNTIGLYGSIKGIAGTAVVDIPELQLNTENLMLEESEKNSEST
jgi:hypothetical protein